jgi:mannose-1-phosphate guanylyltransferase/mannose-6-phosphate isomerase
MLVPVVLSGGSGTRLWPVSREAYPKPFISLPDGECLLQKTMLRLASLSQVSDALIVINRDYYFQARDVERLLTRKVTCHYDWLLEPAGRNTAPAILMAALHLDKQYGSNTLMLVVPADHLIDNCDAFSDAIEQALVVAQTGVIVTFGIKPTRPETGFGYIDAADVLRDGSRPIKQFIEKPDIDTAKALVAKDHCFWNSGMFCMRVDTVINAFSNHHPGLLAQAIQCYEASQSPSLPMVFDSDFFLAMPDLSFDHAIMEVTHNAVMIEARFDWSDIGSWTTIAELGVADEAGNHCDADVVTIDSHNCYFRSEQRLIATVGVDDLLVIDTPDALLIANRHRAQDVRCIAMQLKEMQHPSYRFHRMVYRPWGSYTVLEEGEGFKIKHIVVKPDAILSRQLHYHRNEHWVVVSGTARVTRGEQIYLLLTNQSTYIEAGTAHRLENPGKIDLVMIEVQSGAYLDENDIVRFDDMYGRV